MALFHRGPGLLLLLAALPAVAQPMPDLNAVIDQSVKPLQILRDRRIDPADVAEGCAGGTTGRTLLAFTLATENIGTADLVIGDPGCPACSTDPPPACSNPLYECSIAAGHHHAHFAHFARYEVLAAPDAPAAVVGRKQGFCIEDTICPPDKKTYDCSNQGITAGCRDSYPALLGCQYVDITDLPGGRYLLRASVNLEHRLPESDYDNNTAQAPFEICDAIPQGLLRLARLGRAKNRWTAEGEVVFAKPVLVAADPLRNGARLGVASDTPLAFELVIPGGRRGNGCGPADGWKKLRRGKGWLYTNASGFLDADCAVPASGLRRLRIGRSGDGFSYSARGRLVPGLATAPTRATVTVVAGEQAGPCGVHMSRCSLSGSEATCTGPDPCAADPDLPECGAGGSGLTVPGPRRFSPGEGEKPAGSHFFTSAINGGDASNDGFTGAIALVAGTPGPDGVAPLSVGSDSVFGFSVIDDSVVCIRVDAAGSTGKLDCDGGTAVDVRLAGDSHGDGANDPPVLTTEEGAPGDPGAGYVMANVRVVNCGGFGQAPDPACLGTIASPADCTDPTKVDFGVAAMQGMSAFTTGSATAEILNPQTGSLGGALPQTKIGRPFDCFDWDEDRPGVFVSPQIGYANTIAGDTANVVQLDD